MKWTTENIKSNEYITNNDIYVGTQIGALKKLSTGHETNAFKQQHIIKDLDALDSASRITVLEYGNECKTEILIGSAKPIVQVYNVGEDEAKYFVEFDGTSSIVGLTRCDDCLIAGFANGYIQCITLTEDGAKSKEETFAKAGDDISRLLQCPSDKHIVATGGKGRQNNLKLYDLNIENKPIFTSKNLPNDQLQLEVPVWDSDVGFIDSKNTLATCSRYGYVRVYDTRKQRRPVQCYANDDAMSFTSLASSGNYIYTGTTMGAIKAFDIRQMKTFVHTYKGFTGGISHVNLDSSGKLLASACLDRYVRVHHVDTTKLMYQCYVKSKATCVLICNANVDENCVNNIEENRLQTSNENATTKCKETSGDEEYEEMFANMQKICDNDDFATEAKTQGDGKRKAVTSISKRKKRKTKIV